jgi:predicted nucleotidyltransferase
MNDQIVQVWKYLIENNVNYLTIGGFAVNIYGYGRNTGDIDIFIEDSITNRNNLRKAIKQMGLGDFENIKTMQFIPGWTDINININFRLDIMTSVKGLEDKPFKELLENATIIEINKVKVFFLDYDSLIIAKKASNRPKDILDIEELEKINKPE